MDVRTPALYTRAWSSVLDAVSRIWLAVTTEIDCGVSRMEVSVLVAVALRCAMYPTTGPVADSDCPVTVTVGSSLTGARGRGCNTYRLSASGTARRPLPASRRASPCCGV